MDTKLCRACDTVKPVEEFARRGDRPSGRVSKCKACDRAKASRYYAENRDKRVAYYAGRAEEVAADRAALRLAAERIYGGACEVCGATGDMEFDHPDGDGKAHREVESPSTMFRRIVATGERITDYRLRLLCVPHHHEFTNEQRATA